MTDDEATADLLTILAGKRLPELRQLFTTDAEALTLGAWVGLGCPGTVMPTTDDDTEPLWEGATCTCTCDCGNPRALDSVRCGDCIAVGSSACGEP